MENKPISILVLGIGGGGCNAVQYLGGNSFEGVRLAALNTDSQALARCNVETKLVLGEKSMRGLGAGGDPRQGRLAAEQDSERIGVLCEGADLVFIVAGLGGGTGTGASPIVAKAAKDKGALVLGIVFMPFEFESKKRQEIAADGCESLRSVADGCISLPNQNIFKMVDEKTSALEAFRIINELVAQGIIGIYRLLSRTGLINVDFADLCAVTQSRHSSSVLATAEASGENRAREIWEKVLAHPQVQGGQALTDAASLLVSITGGPDLTMLEINRIMEPIHRQAENAHIIMGANIEEDWKERLAVTLVASLGEGSAARTAEARVRATSVCAVRGAEQGQGSAPELDEQLVSAESAPRPASRFVPPPPALTPERADQLLTLQGAGGRQRKSASRLRQGQLPLEIISKGRFEQSEPTIHQGEDLDVPTYIRRGVALN